jgi:hypothetical protein
MHFAVHFLMRKYVAHNDCQALLQPPWSRMPAQTKKTEFGFSTAPFVTTGYYQVNGVHGRSGPILQPSYVIHRDPN